MYMLLPPFPFLSFPFTKVWPSNPYAYLYLLDLPFHIRLPLILTLNILIHITASVFVSRMGHLQHVSLYSALLCIIASVDILQ